MRSIALRTAAASLLLLAGCVFGGSDFSGTSFLCSDSEPCPPGFDCVSGRCVAGAPGGDGAPPVDGTPPADACVPPDAAPQPQTIPLSDDFDDGVTAPTWMAFSQGNTSVAETGGELVVTLASHPSQTRLAGYDSSSNYDFQGRRMFVEVAQVGNGDAVTRFRMRQDDNNLVFLEHRGGTLHFGTRLGGTTVTVESAAYSVTDHRFWQIREEAGTVFGETSPDGESWAILGMTDAPGFVGAARVQLSAGTLTNVQNPGQARFDNFNSIRSACP